MKHATKLLVLLLTLAMLLSIVPTAVLAANAGTINPANLLADEDADGKPDGWESGSLLDAANEKYPADAPEGYTGNFTYGGPYTTNIEVEANATYKWSFYYKGTGYIQIFKNGWSKFSGQDKAIPTAETWTLYEFQFETGTDINQTGIQLFASRGGVDYDAVYADMKVVKLSGGTAGGGGGAVTPPAGGDGEGGEVVTPPAGGGDDEDGGDVIAPEFTDFNGAFLDQDEDGNADNWGLAIMNDSKPYETYGGNYVTMNATSPRNNDVGKFPMPTEEEDYYITGYVKGSAPRLYFSFRDAEGKQVGEWKQVIYPNGWTAFKYKINFGGATEAATHFVLGICGNNANEASFADLKIYKVKKNYITSITTWGNPDSATAAAITKVDGPEEGMAALKVDLDQVTAGYKRIAAVWPCGDYAISQGITLLPKTAYKVTYYFKTDDITQAPIIRFGGWHTSGNKDVGATLATAADTWTKHTFYFVVPDAPGGPKIEILLGAKYGDNYEASTYMTVSDLLVEKVKTEAVFPESIASEEAAAVKYIFVDGKSSVAAPTAAKAIIALYKKDGENKVLCAAKFVSTAEWAGSDAWRQPAIVDTEFEVPALDAGEYEMSIMTFGATGLSPLSKVFTKTYTIAE